MTQKKSASYAEVCLKKVKPMRLGKSLRFIDWKKGGERADACIIEKRKEKTRKKGAIWQGKSA